ncbi:MAG: T9SS type A sorting domain-containing protein [Ignavibacteriae bacterium]|nr:T9SS type A sorting domain-containing protein [Ignavibacteriota bacterium]
MQVTVANKFDEPNTEYFYEIRRVGYSDRKSVKSEEIFKRGGEEEIALNLPKETRLHTNYPNPFNPVTEIKYDIHEDAYVTPIAYDVLGREIKTLVEEFVSAGFKSVQFDASSLPSGMYFYRLTAGKYSDMKKMILAK